MHHVLCIPSGRPRNLEILMRYVYRERHLFDRCDLWLNARDEYKPYIYALAASDPSFFRVVIPKCYNVNPNDFYDSRISANLREFLFECTDPDTVYVKVDDDICWLEENFFEKLLIFREANPQYLQVIANTINNAMCNYLQQRLGAAPINLLGACIENCWCKCCYGDLQYTLDLHNEFLRYLRRGDISRWKFTRWEMTHGERSPNHVYAWFGEHYTHLREYMGSQLDEEGFITESFSKMTKRLCCYYGEIVAVHFAYSNQQWLYTVKLLDEYEKIAQCLPKWSWSNCQVPG